jgi:uncharacterized membrane protein
MPYPWHPLTIHFPIALYCLGVLFTLLYLWRPQPEYDHFAQWSLTLSWLSMLVSMGVGLIDQSQLPFTDPRRNEIDTHITFAIALFIVTSGVVYARLRWSEVLSRYRLAYLTAILLGLGLLFWTGKLGGQLVYQFGIGIYRDGLH